MQGGGWNSAVYVNMLYMPMPHALVRPTPQLGRDALANPYSEGFDGIYARLSQRAVEQTLSEIFATFAGALRATAGRLELQPSELDVGQVARALVGRPAIDPGTKHDIHVTQPIVPCNTQSAQDNTKISEACESFAEERGHVLGETLIHEHCDGAAFKLRVAEKVRRGH